MSTHTSFITTPTRSEHPVRVEVSHLSSSDRLFSLAVEFPKSAAVPDHPTANREAHMLQLVMFGMAHTDIFTHEQDLDRRCRILQMVGGIAARSVITAVSGLPDAGTTTTTTTSTSTAHGTATGQGTSTGPGEGTSGPGSTPGYWRVPVRIPALGQPPQPPSRQPGLYVYAPFETAATQGGVDWAAKLQSGPRQSV